MLAVFRIPGPLIIKVMNLELNKQACYILNPNFLMASEQQELSSLIPTTFVNILDFSRPRLGRPNDHPPLMGSCETTEF